MAKPSNHRKRRSKLNDPLKLREQQVDDSSQAEELLPPSRAEMMRLLPFLGLFSAVLLYAYWPTFVWVEATWRKEPDYSHGYIVPFLVGLLCWHRSDLFPGFRTRPSWHGLWLIGLAVIMRVAGRITYADFLDAWSLIPMLAGFIWIMFGPKAMRWASPALALLILMFPMPYRAETMVSWRLQGIATEISTVMLRVVGQPAVSESHTIWLNDEQLMVEQACSGLRIFIGVAALAFFWAAMVKRSWIDRLVLLVAVVPLALFVNALRITVVGLLYQVYHDEASGKTIHDVSGYLMIPLAFGLLWGVKTYWEHLYRPLEQMTAKDFVQKPAKA